MTPTEMKFIKAEAAFRKGDKVTALQGCKVEVDVEGFKEKELILLEI